MAEEDSKSVKGHPLIELANDRAVNQVTGFASVAASLNAVELCCLYKSEKSAAPQRSSTGKKYFVDHLGVQEKEHFGTAPKDSSEGRKEEHLAIALFNGYGHLSQGLAIDANDPIRILDYQLPLKAKSDDASIGKVDLLALTSGDQLAVVELKYMPVGATVSRADTPLRAFLEGLAYCAILEADLESLQREAEEKFERPIAKKVPALVLLANSDYWKLYREPKVAGEWMREMDRLALLVKDKLGIPVSYLSLKISDEPIRYEAQRPKFVRPPVIERAW